MRVLSELETMQRVADGNLSMSRFGRCELRLMRGHSGLAQAANDKLCRALRKVMRSQLSSLMVCVPRIFEGLPPGKDRWYGEFLGPRIRADLFKGRTAAGSTFVSRRDAWVGMDDEESYWKLVRAIWANRPVLLVHGSVKGLAAQNFLGNAASVQVMQSMARDAWSDRERLMDECLRWAEIAPRQQPLVYLALGATATVLAHDLTLCGIQAMDMGHMASSWLREGKQAEVAA